jgi:DNA-binding MarR family transcriptional regulator
MNRKTQSDRAVLGPQFLLGKYLPFRINVLNNQLTRRIARFYGEQYKLSGPEWRVMAVLGQSGALNALSVAEQTTMDRVRVSRAIAKLLKSGIVTRQSDPEDRRRAILELTDKGQKIYSRIVPLVQDIEADILAALSTAERTALERVLAKIEAHMGGGAERGDAEFDELAAKD